MQSDSYQVFYMEKYHLISLSQWISRICGSGLILLAFLLTLQSFQDGHFHLDSFIIACILFLFGTGLLKCWSSAKHILAALLLFFAIVIPLGIINPFHAGDQIALSGKAPAIAEILIWLIPLEICLLVFAWIVDLPIKEEA